jgi:hypothetical protein
MRDQLSGPFFDNDRLAPCTRMELLKTRFDAMRQNMTSTND